MAFAIANLRRNPSGSHMTLTGTWTGSVGDANGAVTLKRIGRVFIADFWDSAASRTDQARVPVTTSVSDGTGTVTVHNRKAVTQGRFRIEFL